MTGSQSQGRQKTKRYRTDVNGTILGRPTPCSGLTMAEMMMVMMMMMMMMTSAIKYKCKEMWNINVNATYYGNANIICELVERKECNNDAVLNKEGCNALISYLSII